MPRIAGKPVALSLFVMLGYLIQFLSNDQSLTVEHSLSMIADKAKSTRTYLPCLDSLGIYSNLHSEVPKFHFDHESV